MTANSTCPYYSGCNLQTGCKTKFLKYGGAGQLCKKHTPIGFSQKYVRYQIYASGLKQENNMNNMNNNNMEKWAVSAMCQKPCLLFPINLILLG